MRKHLKNFFIPHEGNNYHPHILHTKRAVLYSIVFIGIKVAIFTITLLLPLQVFMFPDVLAHEQSRIVALTNELRIQKGLPELSEVAPLDTSANFKARDMSLHQYFAHVNPEGHMLSYFLNKVGYKYKTAGENLAMGFSSADDVLSAWKKSPTHYANLIDPEFNELGISMVSGLYDGMETVYVAEHFGTPKTISAPVIIPPLDKTVGVTFEEPVPSNIQVQGEKISLVTLDEGSFVSWEDHGKTTTFMAEAHILGTVKSATVQIKNYSFTLNPTDKAGIYHGQFIAPEASDEFFKTIILPTIQLIGKDGNIINETIQWSSIKIVNPTPIEKYIKAQQTLPSMNGVFVLSRNIYIGFAIFFTIALALKIFIEIKKQHYHIIIQTLDLILLLVLLAII